ncbi:aminoacyl-histidine dipeptidase [Methanolobus bombayensis]|uniref:aminoacyl-histidine dipeptidase n=1 Tax=Methanolobus bombayensis TaxID=38023 RepID=UPI001AE15D68|nr:aminoacyl-histidine dipeptidase [Methanolobus bombayensis]MBP1909977.1 dipeptidase D [Methanolobus bombayensis]
MDEITEKILMHFREISKIPRCSGNEAEIAMWLKQGALSHGFSVKFDSVNNIVIGVPGSKGRENLPPVVIQGHMDMVGEKTRECTHDFTNDPIIPVIDGDWLRAEKTTLGADNGIALAIALALTEDKSIIHPPLELLFTVDEETGLTGANALTHDFVSGRILLNVDSEDEGIFTVGCAGGLNTKICLPLKYSTQLRDVSIYSLEIGGLAGGHSGVDIHEKKANAIKVLASALKALADELDIMILNIEGGSAHNAIPRHAEAIIAMSGKSEKKALSLINDCEARFRSDYAELEPSLSIKLKDAGESDMKPLDDESSKKVISLLLSLPHGVASMSPATPGLVETSNNLATVSIEDDKLIVLTSQRSSYDSSLQSITGNITSIAKDYGASYSHSSAYPPWQPEMSSLLLRQCQEVYQEVFGGPARIEVIHAGLECAVIGSKFDDMDMISFGPTIKNPHSPDERLHIPSVRKVWDFMVALLASFDNKSKFGVKERKK